MIDKEYCDVDGFICSICASDGNKFLEHDGWLLQRLIFPKVFIGDVDNRVDMIVVGKNQQSKFTSTSFFASCGGSCIGEISLKDSGTIHKNYSENKQVACSLVQITEPKITEDYRNGLLYDAVRPGLGKSNSFSICRVTEDQAIIEGSKDLALCYTKVLSEVVQKLGDKQEKA